jgi:hypothetical protein
MLDPISVLNWRAGGRHVIKDNESGWLKRLLKQRGIILTHPNNRNLPLPDKVFSTHSRNLGACQHLNEKQKQIASCSCNLAFKRRWEGASCSGFKYLLK